jgi:hypothetical protein
MAKEPCAKAAKVQAEPHGASEAAAKGSGWGGHGSAFLPYRYIEEGLAVDCWTIVDENISEIARGL